jgi:hypothetical protein
MVLKVNRELCRWQLNDRWDQSSLQLKAKDELKQQSQLVVAEVKY